MVNRALRILVFLVWGMLMLALVYQYLYPAVFPAGDAAAVFMAASLLTLLYAARKANAKVRIVRRPPRSR